MKNKKMALMMTINDFSITFKIPKKKSNHLGK